MHPQWGWHSGEHSPGQRLEVVGSAACNAAPAGAGMVGDRRCSPRQGWGVHPQPGLEAASSAVLAGAGGRERSLGLGWS